MRIITGIARGTRLETLEGDEVTRPTSEIVKEAIFSMIQFDIEGHKVLDLFAGSGQLGLEALSRGASSALFVDADRRASDIVKKNIEKTHFEKESRVINTDYKAAIRTCSGKEKFGIIFLDPPYASDFLKDSLDRIVRNDLIIENGLVICESDSKEPIECEGFEIKKFSRYGRKYVTLLIRKSEEE